MNDTDRGLETPFVKTLASIVRAEDRFGVWEGRSDADLLADFIVTREQRREMPLMADPDPDLLARLEQFHKAVGLTIEKETGLMASPMMTMHHEGFGRVVLLAGRLVVLSRHLRDVHRFGFESFAKLADQGMKLVADGLAAIEKFPDAARA
ncbi:MAG: NifX-associated nitrogen fixation protein [Magnetospirillum sp. WYHS-4]